ncbi:MAG: sigma-70 family RNA polymerase sigma factor [Alphaproteobacteria bacterium]|nr:sigma-70 family RNA polymerase sigma factor [Alphaproteobacteria bacterium]
MSTGEAGDAAGPAFRQQVVAMLPRLRRFARGLTGGSAADADDLVQIAVMRAIERAGQWVVGTRLDSWLFRIVHNAWIDEVRSRKVREADPDADFDRMVGDHGEPRVEASLTLEAVRKATAKLPEEQRAVLMLVCVEGLSYRDAADSLGVPIGTVMSRLARARAALAARLGGARPGAAGGNVIKLG